MNNYFEKLAGTWGHAIGTFTDAISSTPSFKISEMLKTNLSLLGHIMQALGNALIADTIQNPESLEKIGNSIQSFGNLTVVYGILIHSGTETEIELEIVGYSLQAFGNLLDAFSESDGEFDITTLEKIGAILQVIGNSLQALSGILEMKGEEGEYTAFIGNWIQASGALLQALVLGKN